MAVKLFSILSGNRTMANREGGVGAYARTLLPGYGYRYASGIEYTFPLSEAPQDSSGALMGTTKPNTFRKDCCDCPTAF